MNYYKVVATDRFRRAAIHYTCHGVADLFRMLRVEPWPWHLADAFLGGAE